ncbi:MAG: Hsp20/alpha crystallin family protein [Candidatus Caldarchaeum sp.]
MESAPDWDEFFHRIGREVEHRVRDAIEYSMNLLEPLVGDYRRPRADYTVSSTHVYVVVEMPGTSKENIEMQADETSITVSAEYVMPADEYSRLYPFTYGKGYRRTIKLPKAIDPSKIQARYENGLLYIKAEIPKPKGVKIQIE